ncbi:hypothetical protein ACW9HQ_47895, partial [Nocardia gipuzkoensis]
TNPPGTEVLHWFGGEGPRSSTVHYSSVAATDSEVSYSGEVLAGRFRGDNSRKQFTPTAFAPTCAPDSAIHAARGSVRLTLSDAEQ